MDVPDGWSRATVPLHGGRSVSIRCSMALQGSGNGAEVPEVQIGSDIGPWGPNTDPVDQRMVLMGRKAEIQFFF